ncbi:hypothetical protein HID58_027523 [Brassica napus]|uniref:Uncharacterized protein n=1 Tax=Brassica napus TaxID=3708 RepID=A0ABQ8CS76_BRANA|nr:hypothetical protein HID58_027523 [Brassica napus]
MGLKEQQNCPSQRKIAVFIVLAFIPFALFHLCFNNPFSTIVDTTLQDSASHVVLTSYSSSSSQGNIESI